MRDQLGIKENNTKIIWSEENPMKKKFITCLQNWGQIELIADPSCSFGIRQGEEKGHLCKNINK